MYELLSKSKLEQSVAQIRKQHPFLQEMNPIKQKESLRRVVSKIKTANLNQLDKCIWNLQGKDLAVLPLAIVQAQDAALLDRFFKVISLRYDWWMYEAFWLQLQKHFYSETLQHAFQKLAVLINQNDALYDAKPFYISEDFCPLLPLTPISSEDFFQLLFNRFKNLNIKEFMQKKKDFHLQEHSELYQQLLSQYALSCDDFSFFDLKEHFSLFLPLQKQGYLHLFLNRILENEQLDLSQKSLLCYHIHTIFPCFNRVHPIWKKIQAKQVQVFKILVLRHFFKIYCENTEADAPNKMDQKYKFYIQLIPSINDLQILEEDTLFIKLQKSLVIESPKHPAHLYYYTLEQAKFLFEQGHPPQSLAAPHFVVHTLSPTMTEADLKRLQSCRLSFKEHLHHFNLEFLKLKGEFSNGL